MCEWKTYFPWNKYSHIPIMFWIFAHDWVIHTYSKGDEYPHASEVRSPHFPSTHDPMLAFKYLKTEIVEVKMSLEEEILGNKWSWLIFFSSYFRQFSMNFGIF